MLEVTTSSQELALGVDFTEIYKSSDLYKWVVVLQHNSSFLMALIVTQDNKKQLRLYLYWGWSKRIKYCNFCPIDMNPNQRQHSVFCFVLYNKWWPYVKPILLVNLLVKQNCSRNKALIAELSEPHSGSNDLHFPTQYSQSFFTQCWACLWKQRCSYWRNATYTAIRFTFTTMTALLFGSMFWDLGGKR